MILDKSLDDLIKSQREQKQKMKGKTTVPKDTKIPKKAAGGVKSRAAIRTERAIRTAKPNSPYAVCSLCFIVKTMQNQIHNHSHGTQNDGQATYAE
jgi:hypothetical protein